MKICVQHGFSQKEPMHSLFLSHGLTPVHVPFLEHRGLFVEVPDRIPEIVLVSSARTIQFWDGWSQWILKHNVPVIAISKKTQRALSLEGITSFCAKGTGDKLVEMLNTMNHQSFVHIGAAELSSTLQAALESQTKDFVRIPVYRSQQHSEFTVAHDVSLGCLNSERCASIWRKYAPQVPVVCIGETTKKRALKLELNVLGVATEPTREALVQVALSALKNKIPARRD